METINTYAYPTLTKRLLLSFVTMEQWDFKKKVFFFFTFIPNSVQEMKSVLNSSCHYQKSLGKRAPVIIHGNMGHLVRSLSGLFDSTEHCRE